MSEPPLSWSKFANNAKAIGTAQAAQAMAWALFPIRNSAHAQLQMLQ